MGQRCRACAAVHALCCRPGLSVAPLHAAAAACRRSTQQQHRGQGRGRGRGQAGCPAGGASLPLVAHSLPGSGVRVQTCALPGALRHLYATPRLTGPPLLSLQVCRTRTSSRTSGRRAASSRRPVVSVPRVATRRERPALPLLCLCCSRASAVCIRVSNEIFLVPRGR